MKVDTHYELCVSENSLNVSGDYLCFECGEDSDCYASFDNDDETPTEWICESCCEKDKEETL